MEKMERQELIQQKKVYFVSNIFALKNLFGEKLRDSWQI